MILYIEDGRCILRVGVEQGEGCVGVVSAGGRNRPLVESLRPGEKPERAANAPLCSPSRSREPCVQPRSGHSRTPAPDPELRLITCGGTFDPAIGSYLNNVVVYAAQIR